jgi:uncharacterized phiE125 gp8 family phage protein
VFEHIDLVVPPDEEPVGIDELKAQARIVGDEDDALLWQKITTAREQAEEFTRRSLMTQTLDVWYSDWDAIGLFELPRGPIQSITGIFMYDGLSSSPTVYETVDTAIYSLIGDDVVVQDWLPTYRTRRGIRIRVVAGYGDDPEDVPASIREGILEYAAWMYEHRIGETDAKYEVQAKTGAIPEGVRSKWLRYQKKMV